MASIFNKKQLEMKLIEPKLQEFTWSKSVKLNSLVNSDDYIFDIKTIGPGKFSYPYHFHYNCEEILVVLKGCMTLRTPDGFQKLAESDIVFFEKGSSGAHQLYNDTNESCTYLDIKSQKELDVCEYPDSDKINIMNDVIKISLKGDEVDYFYGEENVHDTWKKHGFDFKSEQ